MKMVWETEKWDDEIWNREIERRTTLRSEWTCSPGWEVDIVWLCKTTGARMCASRAVGPGPWPRPCPELWPGAEPPRNRVQRPHPKIGTSPATFSPNNPANLFQRYCHYPVGETCRRQISPADPGLEGGDVSIRGAPSGWITLSGAGVLPPLTSFWLVQCFSGLVSLRTEDGLVYCKLCSTRYWTDAAVTSVRQSAGRGACSTTPASLYIHSQPPPRATHAWHYWLPATTPKFRFGFAQQTHFQLPTVVQ